MRKTFLTTASIFILLHCLSQNVGIGTTTPNAKLEIVGEGNNSSTNALLLKNSLNDTLLRIRNDGRIGMNFNGPSFGRTLNLGGNGQNFFRTDEIFSGAVFLQILPL